MDEDLSTFDGIKQLLKEYIPKETGLLYPGELGLKRVEYFLNLLGNPQEKIKVIHVAGTSGKGSTSYVMSRLLVSQGLRVGLSVSPHVYDLRERLQINNYFLSKRDFCHYFRKILPAILTLEKTRFGKPSYFEILIGLAFYVFWQKKVDFAIMETGLGGWYDATNTVKNPNKITVITNIGLDHTEILGKKLENIALHKGKIIHQGNLAISARQNKRVREVLDRLAKNQRTSVFYLRPGISYKKMTVSPTGVIFDFVLEELRYPKMRSNLLGRHQIRNISLALTTVLKAADKYKLTISEKKIRQALLSVNIPGRMEVIKTSNHTIILDGAHNDQKMKALTQSLHEMYPGKRFNFLVAFKRGKPYKKMLKYILPLAQNITVTSFYRSDLDLVQRATDVAYITRVLKKSNFFKFQIEHNPQKAIKKALQPNGTLVVTGSLYLLGLVSSVI
ncbi:hypothetical protein A3F03_02985 [Candidatus Roizmanbacteria bacterium RIFCSPHIGHO2_12_FULL_41_11]|uniref:tetrahydrofolate synthase n=3 Tax=Candidatus Roizmaniibacteriota TaxID=1752723 RepID=A0A1F7J8H7_9BACT|nr:MAG: hypothetical protein A3F03_02985 [Candidatus Roizmanbacteria bacterium RIFCSPHIGHO2_12_FULL_41_11]OGK51911.1 MAG: hypothetical protein A2966_00845 [Candidatus Roizmanbacteria bacterium RIFCSPLOWO2_01_FULL_41_22]